MIDYALKKYMILTAFSNSNSNGFLNFKFRIFKRLFEFLKSVKIWIVWISCIFDSLARPTSWSTTSSHFLPDYYFFISKMNLFYAKIYFIKIFSLFFYSWWLLLNSFGKLQSILHHPQAVFAMHCKRWMKMKIIHPVNRYMSHMIHRQ